MWTAGSSAVTLSNCCAAMLLQTPKYGLIYHASLIGQAPPKYKGKISRVLAAKCALSIRVDALGDTESAEVGLEGREKVGLCCSTAALKGASCLSCSWGAGSQFAMKDIWLM